MRLLVCTLLLTLFVGLPATAEASPRPSPGREGAWPLEPRPRIDAGFDPPARPWGAGHRGVDLVGRARQPVRSALGGRVAFAARLAGRGVVVVDHGNVRTTYEPVSASVRVGELVGRGGHIGTLQRASSHCFPRACLHWGLLRGRTYLDPLTLVGAGPVRLLPLDGTATGLPLVAAPWRPLTAITGTPRPVRPWGGRGGRPGAADPW